MRIRTTLKLSLAAVLVATTCLQLALAEHQITKFDPPGAGAGPGQGTFSQQLRNSGVIVGYYIDANNVAHGFIRSAHGGYTVIDVPGAAGTQAYGINDEGTVVGWAFDASGVYHGYLRDKDGHFTMFDVPGAGPYKPQNLSPAVVIPLPLTINGSGTVAGTYVDTKNPPMSHCFIRYPNGSIVSFDPAGSVNTLGDTPGITSAGEISGGYFTADSVLHGFVRDPHGTITSFDAPEAGTTPGTGSYASSINDAGTIPGGSIDNGGVSHGFLRFSDGTFVVFDAPGAGTGPYNAQLNLNQGTIANSTNLAGETVGWYVDANYVSHGFSRSRHGRITTYDVPGEGTGPGQGVVVVASINDEGAVVGWYADANNAIHDFIYKSEDD